MALIIALLSCAIVLAGCGFQERFSSNPGLGEPLRLETRDGFGPINNGFLGELTLGDWDNDGWNDLIVFSAGYRGGLLLYRQLPGEGVPRFKAGERIDGKYGLPALGEEGLFWWGEREIGPAWWMDTNRDGLPDLLSMTKDGLVVFPNKGRPGKPFFGPSEKIPIDLGTGICFADLDSDGVMDLLECRWSISSYWPPFNPLTMTPGPAGPVYPGRYFEGRWLGRLAAARLLFHKGLGGMRFAPGEELLDSLLLTRTVGSISPAAGDWDGDGDLDLALTDRVGGLFLFRNAGDKNSPRFEHLFVRHFPLSGLKPVFGTLKAGRSEVELFLVTESSYIFWLDSRGSAPSHEFPFKAPVQLTASAPILSAGNFSVPTLGDLDNDGVLDLAAGNEDGYLTFFKGYSKKSGLRFGKPELIKVEGQAVYLAAGPTDSPQGPLEAAYGYTCPKAADWDSDGRVDLVLSDIRGYYYFLRNKGEDSLSFAPLEILTSEGDTLRSVWRVRPVIYDVDSDGLPDLVTLDRWGRFCWFRRIDNGNDLAASQTFISDSGEPVKLDGDLGQGHVHTGRIKLELTDWDSDGDPDLVYGTARMAESYKVEPTGRGGFSHIDWLENVGSKDRWIFKRRGAVLNRGGIPLRLGWHTASPEAVDWNGDGRIDLLVGTENGRVYLFDRDYIDSGCQPKVH
ncbi:MAG TPA: VCBS repeat-containing protein [archaeon]|nr:VCBS repeat-containing protein [archaeon]